MSNKRFSHLKFILAGLVAGSLALTGCAPKESSEPTETETQSSSAARPTSPGVTSEEEEDDKTINQVNSSFLDAAKLGELEVEESVVVEVETEKNDDIWQVKVIGTDGTAYRMDVSDDGKEIISDIRARDTTSEKREQNLQKLAKFDTNFQETTEAILDLYPGVKFISMHWGSEGGRGYWEATLLTVSGDQFQVTINGRTGEVMSTDTN